MSVFGGKYTSYPYILLKCVIACRWKSAEFTVSHHKIPLMLLPSGPDMVRGMQLHWTRRYQH